MGSAALSVVRFMTEKQKDRDGTKAFPPEIQYGLKNAAMCQLLFITSWHCRLRSYQNHYMMLLDSKKSVRPRVSQINYQYW
ncbi:hypothetical protein A0U90_11185 [Kozakia baliensis]|nr:hypothetical protein A0U90_11185 [Kozakia baliensis]